MYSKIRALFGMNHNMYAFRSNNYYLLYEISSYKRIQLCKRNLLVLLSCDYKLLFFLLLVACILRLQTNNHQTNNNPYPLLNFFVYYKTVLILTFLIFIFFPIFISLLIIALIMTNTVVCVMERLARSWYLTIHLVPAKIHFSRCEACTYLR